MSKRVSAGILLYKTVKDVLFVYLAHPGGPFFKNKDAGWWTIPKGEINDGEDKLACGLREFFEEIGYKLIPESVIDLGSIKQKGGKTVYCTAVEGDIPDTHALVSNLMKMEMPRKSGKFIEIPEIDKAQFFTLSQAKEKMMESQLPFLERLCSEINYTYSPAAKPDDHAH